MVQLWCFIVLVLFLIVVVAMPCLIFFCFSCSLFLSSGTVMLSWLLLLFELFVLSESSAEFSLLFLSKFFMPFSHESVVDFFFVFRCVVVFVSPDVRLFCCRCSVFSCFRCLFCSEFVDLYRSLRVSGFFGVVVFV